MLLDHQPPELWGMHVWCFKPAPHVTRCSGHAGNSLTCLIGVGELEAGPTSACTSAFTHRLPRCWCAAPVYCMTLPGTLSLQRTLTLCASSSSFTRPLPPNNTAETIKMRRNLWPSAPGQDMRGGGGPNDPPDLLDPRHRGKRQRPQATCRQDDGTLVSPRMGFVTLTESLALPKLGLPHGSWRAPCSRAFLSIPGP